MKDIWNQNTFTSQADKILYENGLLNVLNKYGATHITGSYEIGTMTWNDLDLYVVNEAISIQSIYELTDFIFKTFKPKWFEGKEENVEGKTVFFLGFETYAINDCLWNVDIWFFDQEEIDRSADYISWVKNNLADNSDMKNSVIQIKSELCKTPKYGKKYLSIDIYNSVINDHVRSTDEFLKWLEREK